MLELPEAKAAAANEGETDRKPCVRFLLAQGKSDSRLFLWNC